MKTTLTVVVENTAGRAGLLAEHGLSVWIEWPTPTAVRQLLFDTGQGMVLQTNARCLGIKLDQLDAVVLSHGHYDHTGALAAALHQSPGATLYAHPDCFSSKFRLLPDGSPKDVGMPESARQACDQIMQDRCVPTCQPTEVFAGLMATGAVPRVTDFESEPEPFYLDKPCSCVDPLCDDQALFFDSVDGVVVLLGCAHAGVTNTLRYIDQLTGSRPLHAIFGGMHLGNASAGRIEQTVAEIQRRKPSYVGPCHCTGMAATAALHQAMPNQFVDFHVGTTRSFDLLN